VRYIDGFFEPSSFLMSARFSYISSGAKDKQAIQRGAEQTSNSARSGTYKQFAVPLDKQATAFSTKVQLLLPKLSMRYSEEIRV